MPSKKQTHEPSVSSVRVKEKTGKDWRSWFTALDKHGAKSMPHKSIAQLLKAKYELSGWWSQMVTVEYERSRGLRERYQTSDGYSVGATKTIAADVAELFAASADLVQRKKWFPKGAFKASSQTKDKYLNGSWQGTARLNIGFYAKGKGKSQIAVQVSKLPTRTAVESARRAWKAALTKLQKKIEG
jgi:Domain of unknown function (DUF4287)